MSICEARQQRQEEVQILISVNSDFCLHKCFQDHSQSDSLLLESTNECLFRSLILSRFDEGNCCVHRARSLRICQSTQLEAFFPFVSTSDYHLQNIPTYHRSRLLVCKHMQASSLLPLPRARSVDGRLQPRRDGVQASARGRRAHGLRPHIVAHARRVPACRAPAFLRRDARLLRPLCASLLRRRRPLRLPRPPRFSRRRRVRGRNRAFMLVAGYSFLVRSPPTPLEAAPRRLRPRRRRRAMSAALRRRLQTCLLSTRFSESSSPTFSSCSRGGGVASVTALCPSPRPWPPRRVASAQHGRPRPRPRLLPSSAAAMVMGGYVLLADRCFALSGFVGSRLARGPRRQRGFVAANCSSTARSTRSGVRLPRRDGAVQRFPARAARVPRRRRPRCSWSSRSSSSTASPSRSSPSPSPPSAPQPSTG